VPVAFEVGGANRGARDNQFGFTAYGPTGAVPDNRQSKSHMGGLAYNRTLKPGETFSKQVDVSKWFALKAGWSYTLNGTYKLAFYNPADNNYVPIGGSGRAFVQGEDQIRGLVSTSERWDRPYRSTR
jgi:hypothetical protein